MSQRPGSELIRVQPVMRPNEQNSFHSGGYHLPDDTTANGAQPSDSTAYAQHHLRPDPLVPFHLPFEFEHACGDTAQLG